MERNTYEDNKGTAITSNTAHDILRQWPRRAVLEELSDVGGLSTAELADRLAHREDAPELGSPKNIHISLHHVHLPKLTGCGVVREVGGNYQRTPAANTVEEHRA